MKKSNAGTRKIETQVIENVGEQMLECKKSVSNRDLNTKKKEVHEKALSFYRIRG